MVLTNQCSAYSEMIVFAEVPVKPVSDDLQCVSDSTVWSQNTVREKKAALLGDPLRLLLAYVSRLDSSLVESAMLK